MRLSLVKMIAAVAIFGSAALPTFAAPQLNWGSQINSSTCDKVGSPVINVTQKVANDVDSGLNGNWAFDNLTRHITVWATSTVNEYCTEVSYQGKYNAQAGQISPGDQAQVLTGDEDGTFQGGYNAIITGTLLSNPTWKTNGSIGTTDYMCDLAGNCPGYVSWTDQYFDTGYGFNYNWWGWIYRNGTHTWINASTGNSGDIL